MQSGRTSACVQTTSPRARSSTRRWRASSTRKRSAMPPGGRSSICSSTKAGKRRRAEPSAASGDAARGIRARDDRARRCSATASTCARHVRGRDHPRGLRHAVHRKQCDGEPRHRARGVVAGRLDRALALAAHAHSRRRGRPRCAVPAAADEAGAGGDAAHRARRVASQRASAGRSGRRRHPSPC